MSGAIVVQDAEVDGSLVNVTWADGTIVDVVPRGERSAVRTAGPIRYVDGAGGALIPGIHDHHIHLAALAASRSSVHVGPADVSGVVEFVRALTRACEASPNGWVRAVGYHEAVAGELDADVLDALVPAGADVAIRVQHRSGQLWVLNRRAVELTGLESLHQAGVERHPNGRPTGRVYGLDAVLRSRFPRVHLDLAAVGRELSAYGVTGVTDLTPTEDGHDVDVLAERVLAKEFPVRVTITGGLRLDRTAAPGLTRGPVKLLPADHDLPDPDLLAADIRAAHAAGRNVAVHCVSRIGLVVAMAAWLEVGSRPGDRIEHGGVIPEELIDQIDALGLTVVTQPNFVAERGDSYLSDVEPDDVPHLWRCGSLIARGVRLAAGTDAPYGHPDPWRAVVAATRRLTSSGAPLGLVERTPAATALDLFLGSPMSPTVPRRIARGAVSDLCLLDRPLSAALEQPSAAAVRMTIGRSDLEH